MKFRSAMLASLLSLGVVAVADSSSLVLTLEDAVALALADDPGAEIFKARATSYRHDQVAATKLPEPVLRTGMLNVPVDGFALNVEPMTQGVVGVRQVIPPRGVRKAQSLSHEHQAQAMQWLAEANLKETRYATRTAWLNAYLYQHAIVLTTESRELLASLTQIVRARYAAGDELQLAVLAAELERNRLENRLLDMQRLERNALADLASLIGATGAISISADLPEWHTVPSDTTVRTALQSHPRISAAVALVDAEAAQVEHRAALFNPEWHVDVSYGLRSGSHQDGQSRADLASAMVSVSLSWFSKQQNQARLDAARARKEAARQTRHLLMREMNAELIRAYADWRSHSERLELLVNAIVPQSQSHAQAALQAYQNKEGSYTDVLLSYVDGVDAKLDLLRVRIERLKTWAKIDSLNGMTE